MYLPQHAVKTVHAENHCQLNKPLESTLDPTPLCFSLGASFQPTIMESGCYGRKRIMQPYPLQPQQSRPPSKVLFSFCVSYACRQNLGGLANILRKKPPLPYAIALSIPRITRPSPRRSDGDPEYLEMESPMGQLRDL